MQVEISPIHTPSAPAAIGPYSQAILAGGMVFTSGQIALSPDSGQLVGTDIESQTRQVFKNLEAVLTAAGSSLSRAVKVTVYLQDMNDFPKLNQIYGEVFGDTRPARSTIQVARLPRDAQVEIDVIALR